MMGAEDYGIQKVSVSAECMETAMESNPTAYATLGCS